MGGGNAVRIQKETYAWVNYTRECVKATFKVINLSDTNLIPAKGAGLVEHVRVSEDKKWTETSLHFWTFEGNA
ncbi:hypothetical protein PGB90_000160 [Kerria lacca]